MQLFHHCDDMLQQLYVQGGAFRMVEHNEICMYLIYMSTRKRTGVR